MWKLLTASLALTLAVECLIAWLWGLRRYGLLLVILANTMTNPLAVTLHTLFPAWWVTVFLEAAAVAAEGFAYRTCRLPVPRPWLLSLTANGVSFLTGVAVNQLL